MGEWWWRVGFMYWCLNVAAVFIVVVVVIVVVVRRKRKLEVRESESFEMEDQCLH